ncbi:MAG: LacI family transcriptional regulator [Glaciecola sp.]
MQSIKKVTLRDLANHLGINTSSVSRALNPKTRGMLTPELVAQVKKIADELGYVQNTMAYALKTGRSMNIGVIIPDLMNPIYPPILKGIINVLSKASYTPLIAYSENNIATALDEIKKMKMRQVDGFILACAYREDEAVEYCLANHLPTVTVGRSLDAHKLDQIVIDNEAGVKLAIRHLISLGHKNIAFASGPLSISDGNQRYEAFKKEILTNGLILDESLIVLGDGFTEVSGRDLGEKLVKQDKPFSAIVAGNDLLALGCICALENAGLACPADVSVIGFNNMPYLSMFKTPLTTIAIPRMEMGKNAAEVILSRLMNPEEPLKNITVTPELIERGSTSAAKIQTG